jgi:hypothetical protein
VNEHVPRIILVRGTCLFERFVLLEAKINSHHWLNSRRQEMEISRVPAPRRCEPI